MRQQDDLRNAQNSKNKLVRESILRGALTADCLLEWSDEQIEGWRIMLDRNVANHSHFDLKLFADSP